MMQRFGMVIRLKAGSEERYKRYHAAVWPEVLSMIHECHIRNYSIYLKNGILFSYFEYHGTDFEADMAQMAADPATNPDFSRGYWQKAAFHGITEFPHSS